MAQPRGSPLPARAFLVHEVHQTPHSPPLVPSNLPQWPWFPLPPSPGHMSQAVEHLPVPAGAPGPRTPAATGLDEG